MDRVQLRPELLGLKTVVIKVGSRILASEGSEPRVEGLVEDLAALHDLGLRVVLVSSGAIAHGMPIMGLARRPSTIPLQQACASVGQNQLMNRYQSYFTRHGIIIGQVLLTWDDLRSKKRYLNLRNTMFQLLESGIIPVVNENDSVGVEEIQFGTNDILGAQIAILVQAELLVNLTDVGGLFDRNPNGDPAALRIPVVTQMSEALKKLAGDATGEISVGGMRSKLKAADMVMRAGIACLIGDGFSRRLSDVLSREECSTLFLPSRRRMPSRRRWLAFSGTPQGALIIDEGAQRAIVDNGKSLLPAGIKSVSGAFNAGDNVDIITEQGSILARGLVNYSANEIYRILGCKTTEIEERLGKKEFDEVIHRDKLVLL